MARAGVSGCCQTELRCSICPQHVVAFIRACSGLQPGDLAIVGLSIDEAQALNHLPNLLSAFVQFKLQSVQGRTAGRPAETLPMCCVAATLWSCVNLLHTRSDKATICQLRRIPLNNRQQQHLTYLVLKRIEMGLAQAAARRQQDAGPSAMSQAAAASVIQRYNHYRADQAQPSPSGNPSVPVWPRIDLRKSNSLPMHNLPPDLLDLLRLVGGIPRLIAFLSFALKGSNNLGKTKGYGIALWFVFATTA